jgi:O-antigen biosynthesis protein
MKTSVVIPAYNNWALLHQLLYDIHSTKGTNEFEVIVVNDKSTEDGFVDGLSWWQGQKMLPLSVISNESNLGFLYTANKGLKVASGDIVILITTDVRVYKGFFEQIEDRLAEYPKTLISGKVYRETTGWNKFGEKIFPYAEGFVLATTNEGWKELGYFDPRYVPNDAEDMDLSTTALSKGYELWELPRDTVLHLGGKTLGYGEEREKITRRNIEKFAEKWDVYSK